MLCRLSCVRPDFEWRYNNRKIADIFGDPVALRLGGGTEGGRGVLSEKIEKARCC